MYYDQADRKCRTRATNDLQQMVRIINPGCTEYSKSVQAISRLIEFFDQSMGQQIVAPFAVHNVQARELLFYTCLLTPAHCADTESVLKLPKNFDSSNTLEHLRGENKFVFTEDNRVTFEEVGNQSSAK